MRLKYRVAQPKRVKLAVYGTRDAGCWAEVRLQRTGELLYSSDVIGVGIPPTSALREASLIDGYQWAKANGYRVIGYQLVREGAHWTVRPMV